MVHVLTNEWQRISLHTYIHRRGTYVPCVGSTSCMLYVCRYVHLRGETGSRKVPRSRYVSTQHTTHRSVICTHMYTSLTSARYQGL